MDGEMKQYLDTFEQKKKSFIDRLERDGLTKDDKFHAAMSNLYRKAEHVFSSASRPVKFDKYELTHSGDDGDGRSGEKRAAARVLHCIFAQRHGSKACCARTRTQAKRCVYYLIKLCIPTAH